MFTGVPIVHEREKLRRRFAVQTDAAMRPRIGMNEALMKSVGGREFTPVAHRITDIAAGNVCACIGRNDAIALHTEAVGTGAFVFLLGINREVASRRRLARNADRSRRPPSGADHLP